MLFSSLIFLYAFLPVTLLFYYLFPGKLKNAFLFIVSFVFIAWGGLPLSFIMLLSIGLNYTVGRLIDKSKNPKIALSAGIIMNLAILVWFKYAGFLIENINPLLVALHLHEVKLQEIILPIGISFYTFQAISYLVDVYRKTTVVQKNILNLGLYISFFPQLIAGPIVRYHDIQQQIFSRKHSLENFRIGVERFTLGFAKKVIIANRMGFIADHIFSLPSVNLTVATAWIGIAGYSLQIYFDFAGYSDMAIGLARMFGFKLQENFNFPYMSKSIKEFWRRWHISLSQWFRDYLYIPLGGNRHDGKRTVMNLLIVFFVTGFWHGAGWNFLLWGLLHGFFLIIERSKFGHLLQKLPSPVQIAYTLFISFMAWVLFRTENLHQAQHYYLSLFGMAGPAINDKFVLFKIINTQTLITFTAAILGAFGFFPFMYKLLKKTAVMLKLNINILLVLKTLTTVLFILFVLLYGTGKLVIDSYNPFIYFRF